MERTTAVIPSCAFPHTFVLDHDLSVAIWISYPAGILANESSFNVGGASGGDPGGWRLQP